MIASGYVDATRGNAERLIDLMSLNDSTAVVSFNGTAAIELPLTQIPWSLAKPRATVWTPTPAGTVGRTLATLGAAFSKPSDSRSSELGCPGAGAA
jgi:hypothetical protein